VKQEGHTMKIGIDIDDVLVETWDAICAYHNHTFGTHFTQDDGKMYSLSAIFGRSDEQIRQELNDFYYSPYYMNMKPVPESVTEILSMKEDHELHIISSRPNYSIDHTKKWLEQYFPQAFFRIHITRHVNPYGDNEDGKLSKAEVCQQESIQLLIEDSVDYLKECTSENTNGILIDKPWNQGSLPPYTTRVFSWKEIVETINQLVE
jgi:uncharacterized HAD superfamily protein